MSEPQKQTNALAAQTPEMLAENCRRRQPDNSHEFYCFELFRRAILYCDEHC